MLNEQKIINFNCIWRRYVLLTNRCSALQLSTYTCFTGYLPPWWCLDMRRKVCQTVMYSGTVCVT